MPNADDFAQLVTTIFSECLKIELEHNLEKKTQHAKMDGQMGGGQVCETHLPHEQ